MTKNSPGSIRPLPKPSHGSNSGPDGVDLIVQEPVLASTNLDRCTSSRLVLRLLAQMGHAIEDRGTWWIEHPLIMEPSCLENSWTAALPRSHLTARLLNRSSTQGIGNPIRLPPQH